MRTRTRVCAMMRAAMTVMKAILLHVMICILCAWVCSRTCILGCIHTLIHTLSDAGTGSLMFRPMEVWMLISRSKGWGNWLGNREAWGMGRGYLWCGHHRRCVECRSRRLGHIPYQGGLRQVTLSRRAPMMWRRDRTRRYWIGSVRQGVHLYLCKQRSW